jgi:hypothetical protein
MTNTARIMDAVKAEARALGYAEDPAVDGFVVWGKEGEAVVLQFDTEVSFRILIVDIDSMFDDDESVLINWSAYFDFDEDRVNVEAAIEAARASLRKAIALL